MTIRIDNLPSAGALTGDEVTVVVQSGVSKKSSVSQIVDYAGSQVGSLVTQAQNAANNAQSSAAAAALSESAAGTSETNAALSETNAAASESAAQGYAAQAYISANQAAGYAVDAGDIYTDFDKRYLGPKALDPTSDNQGHALVDGALYWSTSTNVMKTYANGGWETAYAPTGEFLLASNNLSDLVNVATARSNLGLGDAATLSVGTTAGTVAAGDHLHTGVYEPADATILKSAAIGVTIQPYDATILKSADIGVTVQGYNVNTVIDANYVHTDNNYTTTEKNKLAGIADGAEVNVNADWNAVSGDAQILNKPTLGTAAALDAGVANGAATLDANAKIQTNQLPAIAITNTFVVASEAAMLALTAETGDVAVRTDLSNSFILTTTPASTLANWQELLTPTDTVTSVNGQTGVVSLSYTNVGAAPATTGTAILKGNGAGGFSDAAAGTDYLAPAAIGTTVQGYSANLTTWAGKTAPTGTAVGTTDTQTLTNKTITLIAGYETKVAVSASAIDLATGNYFSKTISGTTTFTISNTPSTGTAASFILDLTNGGSATVNWWSGVKWAGGTAPTLTTSGRDVLGFFTHDGGTTWTGLTLGKDVK